MTATSDDSRSKSQLLLLLLILLLVVGTLFYLLTRGDPCGNGTCDPGETFATCGPDCPSHCGDGTCGPGETPSSCPGDCGETPPSCGDGVCGPGETPTACPADCPAPPPPCGDGVCGPGETPASCPADCDSRPTPTPCGDGVCGPDESPESCPRDCHPPPTPCGDGTCGDGETHDTCAADCPAPDTCGDGHCDDPAELATGRTPCPADCQPAGRCRNPDFRDQLAAVIADCKSESDRCKGLGTANPMVALSQERFKLFFGQPSDSGVGNHFMLFGCNVFSTRTGDCLGYDSYYTDPAKCPTSNDSFECAKGEPRPCDGGRRAPSCDPSGAVERCRMYSRAIESDFERFMEDRADSRYFAVLGTASLTGNGPAGSMSACNQGLAFQRASRAKELLLKLMNKAKKRLTVDVSPVILDNHRFVFDDSEMQELIRAQLARTAGTDRGFVATTSNALNRSALILAIRCDLSAELKAHGGR